MKRSSPCASLLAGLCAGWFVAPGWQDPVKPLPEPSAPVTAPNPSDPALVGPPLPAVATVGAAVGATVPLGTPARHATEGVYALRKRVSEGRVDAAPCSGYLAITNRHLFLCLAEDAPVAGTVLLRAGVRSWRVEKDRVRTTTLCGWLTDADGGIVLERKGHEELRKIVLVKGGVQVKQDDRNWLEFERIE